MVKLFVLEFRTYDNKTFGSCVGVLWMMFWMRLALASSGLGGVHRVPSEG